MRQPLRFVIEFRGTAAGLVVEENNRYRFFASDRSFAPLEHRLFRSPDHAEQICKRFRESPRRVFQRGR
jgi:hypothetical protein